MPQPPINDINNNTGLIGIGPIPNQSPIASFQVDQIENLLRTKGILAYHYLHTPNPDREKVGGPVSPNTQAAAHRGYWYYKVRPFLLVPQAFKMEDRLMVQGIWGKGSVLMNVTGHYVDNEPNNIVYVRNRDLIVLNRTVTTMTEQLFEYNPTGPQRLNYKIHGVDFLADKNYVYTEGIDFVIKNEMIEWIEGTRPAKDAVLTCVYYISPIYIVVGLPHSLRILPSNPQGHGAFPREAKYAPQQVVVQQSTIIEENNIMDWFDLPPFPEYSEGGTTGGSI